MENCFFIPSCGAKICIDRISTKGVYSCRKRDLSKNSLDTSLRSCRRTRFQLIQNDGFKFWYKPCKQGKNECGDPLLTNCWGSHYPMHICCTWLLITAWQYTPLCLLKMWHWSQIIYGRLDWSILSKKCNSQNVRHFVANECSAATDCKYTLRLVAQLYHYIIYISANFGSILYSSTIIQVWRVKPSRLHHQTLLNHYLRWRYHLRLFRNLRRKFPSKQDPLNFLRCIRSCTTLLTSRLIRFT